VRISFGKGSAARAEKFTACAATPAAKTIKGRGSFHLIVPLREKMLVTIVKMRAV
jgi:hypothetical protein